MSLELQPKPDSAPRQAPEGEPVCLIDGHSLTFKAYYGVRGLTGPDGKPTGAVFGFLRMLLKLIEEIKPTHLAVVFDTGKPTFRSEIYPKYKANREAPPPDFGDQMDWILRLLKAMGVVVYQKEGYEADDLIATMAAGIERQGGSSLVVSADKDLFQLVGGKTWVARFGTDDLQRFDVTAVEEKMGVAPARIPDWLAIVGDSSDNIPGVPGIGPKGAVKLLQEFGSLEALIAGAEQVKPARHGESLRQNADQARMSLRLATVDRDVPFDWKLEDCRLPGSLWSDDAIAILRQLGFDSLIKEKGLQQRSAAIVEPVAPAKAGNYRLIYDEAELAAWVEKALTKPWIAIDTETTGVDAMLADLVGVCLACESGDALYVPVGHRIGARVGNQMPVARLREILSPIFRSEGSGPGLTAHHAKYDWKILEQAGFDPPPPRFDTMIASFVLDPGRVAGHGLKALASEFCGVQMQPITEIIGSGKNAVSPAEITPEDLFEYAAKDADVTLRLTEFFEPRLRSIEPLRRLFEEIEIPLIPVLHRMEMGGIGVDVRSLEKLGTVMAGEIDRLTKEIWRQAGRDFNIASTRQLAEVLFDELGLPQGRKTKTGFSTDNDVLELLADRHPIVQSILDFRALVKLKNTYADTLPRQVNPRTRRIHTSFNQTIAQTGRLSSTEPNLQNIPIRTELGREIRRAFIPDSPGHRLLSADYSQIELRILAHVSGDATLRAAYAEGRDIHALTAAQVFGVRTEDVTSDMRAKAKVINFGIIYGMSAHGLSQRLRIPRADAARFIDAYFASYPGVRRWIDATLEEARHTGYVETLRGRRRWLPDLTAKNGQLRANAERIAMNTPIQGTSADMIKLAMIDIDRELHRHAPGTRMVLQVHDELIFSTPIEEIPAAEKFVREAMIGALPLDVPIAVDISTGENWAECA